MTNFAASGICFFCFVLFCFFPHLPREGDKIIEEEVVANALHVYALCLRCSHFVGKIEKFLGEKRIGTRGRNHCTPNQYR